MKALFLFVALASFPSVAEAGLTVEEILRIAGEPASDAPVPPEFAKFPQGSRYRISTIVNEGDEPTSNIVELKYVKGGYSVSETRIVIEDIGHANIVMVTKYDGDVRVYRKSVLIREKFAETSDKLVHLIGNFLPDRRVMNWTSFPDEDGKVVTAIDAFTDESSTAREIVLRGGKIVHAMTIKAERIEE